MPPFLLALALAATAPPPAACQYDPAVLTLGVDAFDQDLKGGWRPLTDKTECLPVAADLVQKYREKQQSMMTLLYWHEGQIRAFAGQNKEAVALLSKSKKPDDDDEIGWNAYADATIAFLRGDRAGLLRARRTLAAWPRPRPDYWVDEKGKPLPWPANLDVVDALTRCFGKPYSEAYGSEQCRLRASAPAK